MKRILAMLALLFVVGAGAASAQTRVGVTISFGDPFVAYHPRPYGYSQYRYNRYFAYRHRPTIVVVRPYRPARVIVMRHHRSRGRHRGW